MLDSRHVRLLRRTLSWISVAGLLAAASAWGAGAQHRSDASRAARSGTDDVRGLALESDSLIREVFAARDTARYEEVAEAYLSMLATGSASPENRAVRLLHLRHVLRVMPAADRPSPVETDDGLLAAGPAVAAWWRRQDPFPATRQNERLEEHLTRMVDAFAAFPSDDDLGIDARGELYVRLGPPTDRLTISLPPSVRAFDLWSDIPLPRLADNELWVYDHISDEAHYFFLRNSRRSGYRLAPPHELIPSQLRSGFAARSERGREKAEMLLHVAEEIYAQLALAHPFYGATFDDIAHYRGRPSTGSDLPSDVAQSILADASSREMEAAGRRADVVPESFSNTRGLTDDLPVEVRPVRFLEEDGSTRTEMYWMIDLAEIHPERRLVNALEDEGFASSDRYVLVVSAARMEPDYRVRDIGRRFYLVEADARGRAPRTFVLEGDTSLFHVGAQWDLYWAKEEDDGLSPYGPALRTGTVRLDSLEALSSRRFEMSDVKPLEGDTPVASSRLGRSPPELYFELYNLHYGADDRTSYTIQYEVRRSGNRGERPTRARRTQSGADRSTSERIDVDLSDEASAGPVRLRVRVIDEVSGEERVRDVTFDR